MRLVWVHETHVQNAAVPGLVCKEDIRNERGRHQSHEQKIHTNECAKKN